MAIKFNCSCGREISVKDEHAGKKGKCPACGQVVQVPMPEEAKAAAPVEAAPEPEAAGAAEPAGETKTCMHCRKKIPSDSVFCTHCGTDLRTGKKHVTGSEDDDQFDFFKTAPDMIASPMIATGTIVEASPSAQSFQKALICIVASALLYGWVVAHAGGTTEGPPLWVFGIAVILTLVVTVISGIIVNIAGTMFGTTGVGFANSFMAVIAARAVLGLGMILPLILLWTMPDSGISYRYLPMVIRMGWGTFLMYCVIYRSHDCGQVPALTFGALCAIIEGLVFWLVGLIIGHALI